MISLTSLYVFFAIVSDVFTLYHLGDVYAPQKRPKPLQVCPTRIDFNIDFMERRETHESTSNDQDTAYNNDDDKRGE